MGYEVGFCSDNDVDYDAARFAHGVTLRAPRQPSPRDVVATS